MKRRLGKGLRFIFWILCAIGVAAAVGVGLTAINFLWGTISAPPTIIWWAVVMAVALIASFWFTRWLVYHHLKTWLIALGCLVVLAVAAHFTVFYYNAHLYEQARQQWAADGLPKTLVAALPKPVPDTQNRAVAYQQAMNKIIKTLDAMPDNQKSAIDKPWTADATVMLAKCHDGLVLMRAAQHLPDCVWPLRRMVMGAPMPWLTNARRVAYVLSVQAAWQFRHHNLNEGLAALAIIAQLARDVGDERVDIANLVGVSLGSRCLHIFHRAMNHTGRSGRLVIQTLASWDQTKTQCQTLAAEPFYFENAMPFKPRQASPFGLSFGSYPRAAAGYWDLHRHLIDFISAGPSGPDILKWNTPVFGYLAPIIYPTRKQTLIVLMRFRSRVALAQCAVALRAYKHQHTHYPKTLTAIGKPAIDPWNGKPFIYQYKNAGFTLTSQALTALADLAASQAPSPKAKARARRKIKHLLTWHWDQ